MQGSQANLNTPGGSRRPEQVLRPVTIKQLLEAEPSNTESTLVIQDMEISNVSFYGVVREIKRNPTHVLLQIEDGTGMIEVRKWIDASDGETEGLDAENGIQEHDWVKVMGSPKIFNKKRHVAGLRLQKVEDHNQINYHLLDVIRVTLTFERGAWGGNSMQIDQPASKNATKQYIEPPHDAQNPKQAKIMNIFVTNATPDEGVHMQEIAKMCQLDLDDAIEEIGKLISEGLLYTTVDDNHVKPTTD